MQSCRIGHMTFRWGFRSSSAWSTAKVLTDEMFRMGATSD